MLDRAVSLVDQRLFRAMKTQGDDMLYRMLEAIRNFAEDHIVQAGGVMLVWIAPVPLCLWTIAAPAC